MINQFNNQSPIYLQIINEIELRIFSGIYKPGDKLPSVREFAEEISVNPNTVQKALSEMENEGLIFCNRTSGRFITEDRKIIRKKQIERATTYIAEFSENILKLGFDIEKELSIIKNKILSEENDNG